MYDNDEQNNQQIEKYHRRPIYSFNASYSESSSDSSSLSKEIYMYLVIFLSFTYICTLLKILLGNSSYSCYKQNQSLLLMNKYNEKTLWALYYDNILC